jgi:hypothetical protein
VLSFLALAFSLTPSIAAAAVPSIESESVSGITSTNAILEAQINPHEIRGADYQFQLVTEPEEYASEILCPNLLEDVILCIGPVAEGVLPINYAWKQPTQVSLDLSSIGVSLRPGTTYHYRVLAARSALTEDTTEWEEPTVFGVDQTFTTAETPSVPSIESESVSGITSTNAILEAQVSPPEDDGAYLQFQLFTNPREFDTNPEINCPEPPEPGPLCIGISYSWKHSLPILYVFEKATPVSLDLSEVGVTLQPDTTYFYRALAARAVPSEDTIEWEEPPIVYGAKRYFTTPEDLPTFPLTVAKAGNGTGTVTSSPAGISCGATCSAPFTEGETVVLTGTPSLGSKKVVWSDCPSVSEQNKCRVTISAAKEVTATFDLKETVLQNPTPLKVGKTGEGTVVSSPAGVSCGATCEANFEKSSTITLTASPAVGYAFSAWAGCTEHTGLTCKVKMDKAKTVKATFVETPSLTVEKAGTGYGKVATTGINCDESCSKESSAVKTGTAVTVKVTPAKGNEFVTFEGGTGNASSCSATCTFTISEASSVKVKFVPIPSKTLTVELTGPGAYKGKVIGKVTTAKGLVYSAISCGSGCTTETESFFATGETELTALASTGYNFAGWTVTGGSAGNCTGTTTPCKLATDANKTVKAKFE